MGPVLIFLLVLAGPLALDALFARWSPWHVLRRVMWFLWGLAILALVVGQAVVTGGGGGLWGLLPLLLLTYWFVGGAWRRARLKHPPAHHR